MTKGITNLSPFVYVSARFKYGLLIYYRLDVSYLVCLRDQSQVPIVWNTRETGDINNLSLEL